MMNVTKANLVGEPEWEVIHDFVSEYSIPDVSPDSFFEIASQVQTN